MSHLHVAVDGETKYDGEVQDWVLPSQPDLYPAALRAQADPNAKPSPLAKLLMLTALTELMRRTLESPMLQPLDVELRPRGMGCFTLTVNMPNPMANANNGP